MGRSVNAKIAALPRARRAKVRARAAQLVAEEMSLQALRKALGHTQAKLAEELGVGQDTVSRYEQRADMLLSTLQQYVRAMGGSLCLIAEFPDRPAVRISTLAEIGG
jgi:DNA-binding XRE family transcriptional regulator